MRFTKPPLEDLKTESDVEQKLLYPLLVSSQPDGLGLPDAAVRTEHNLRSFLIGKGKSQKSYFPDYLVVFAGLPLLVVEAKPPRSDLTVGFTEARMYANELNAICPNGINPISKIIACDGTSFFAGNVDEAENRVPRSRAMRRD